MSFLEKKISFFFVVVTCPSSYLSSVPPGVVSVLYSSEEVVQEETPYEIKLLRAPGNVTHLRKFNTNYDFAQKNLQKTLFGAASSSSDDYRAAARESGNICSLDIRVDYGVFKDNGKDYNKIRGKVYQMVMTANRIYQGTFRRADRPAFKFVVGRLAVANDAFCRKYRADIHCHRSVRSSDSFLNIFSR